jgi:hypothetical protein
LQKQNQYINAKKTSDVPLRGGVYSCLGRDGAQRGPFVRAVGVRQRILNKLLASERTAATFNSDYSVGTIRTATDTEYLLFNSDKMPRVFIVEDTGTFIDMFTGRETAADALLTVTVGGNDAVWMKKTHRREAEQ